MQPTNTLLRCGCYGKGRGRREEREGEKERKDRGVREREKRRKWAGGERKGGGKDEAPTSKSVVMRTREEPDRNSLIIRSRSF